MMVDYEKAKEILVNQRIFQPFAWLTVGLLWSATAVAAADRAAASIFGELVLKSGETQRGALRWEEEESLWLHHFNARKLHPTDLDALPAPVAESIRDDLPGRQLTINDSVIELNPLLGRHKFKPQTFVVEFGSIKELQIGEAQRVDLVLLDGTTISADGGSNDIGADIEIIDSSGERREIDWDAIESIRFSQAPSGHPLFEPHLWGVARTSIGEFTGTISWDRDEAYPSQILDWETEDNEEIETPFSSIVALERDGSGTQLTTTDGQRRWVDGSNDVNNENRGLMLHVPKLGLLEVPWQEFESVTFTELPVTQLPSRQDFTHIAPLHGTLTRNDGQSLDPKPLVFDLNQVSAAEHLVGKNEDVEVSLPWRLIRSVAVVEGEPRAIKIGLTQGEWVLNGVTQVPGGNFGWLYGEQKQRLKWQDFARAQFLTANTTRPQ